MVNIALVVLAGRNKDNLIRLVNSISQLHTYPNEIIIILDMKNIQETDLELPTIIDKDISYIKYFDNGVQPHMRNLALENTTAEYMWFVDDDVSIQSNAIDMLLTVINDIDDFEDVGGIAGRIIEKKEVKYKPGTKPIYFSFLRGPIGFFDLEENLFPFHVYDYMEGKSGHKYPIIPFVQGTSMVFKTKNLKAINGFDENLGVGYSSFEDSDISFAFLHRKIKTIYSPNVTLEHHKMLRVGGEGRGYQSYEYNFSLIRNYAITILKNSFPNRFLSPFYVLIFSFVHFFRVIYHINGVSIKRNTIKTVWKSFKTVCSGMLAGAKLSVSGKRINSFAK